MPVDDDFFEDDEGSLFLDPDNDIFINDDNETAEENDD
jgi:hypothetical protein